jgi:hypothetical protein
VPGCGELLGVEVDAGRRSGPTGGFVRWAPVLGIVALLLIGLLAYAVIAPSVRQSHKVERAVRTQHPEFTHVSCHQPDPMDMTKYMCNAKGRLRTACVYTAGSAERPLVEEVSYGSSC